MPNRPYSAADVADELGRGVDWFYRHYRTLVDHCGMPPSIVPFGHYRFRRADMDRWLAMRKNPAFNAAPANDPLPPLDLAQEREALAHAYGTR